MDLSEYKTDFICPKCGSEEWGTSNCTASDLKDMTGHCSNCPFSWSRDKDSEVFSIDPYGYIRIKNGEIYSVPYLMQELFESDWCQELTEFFESRRVRSDFLYRMQR